MNVISDSTKQRFPNRCRHACQFWLLGLAMLSVLPFANAEDQTPTQPLVQAQACASWLNHSIKQLHGSEHIDLCAATAGKPVLLINTASFCGFTKQFKGLESLHQQYKDQDLVVIGFPSNDFKQEAGSEEETAKVCFYNFGVTFLMTTHVPVVGDDAHPIFQHLGRETDEPSWNFNKYLIDRNGKVVEHFSSYTSPDSRKMHKAVKMVL